MKKPIKVLNKQLAQAVKDKDLKAVKEAIAEGADVNTTTEYWDDTYSVLAYAFFHGQETFLIYIMQSGEYDISQDANTHIIKTLLEAGANPNFVADEDCPSHKIKEFISTLVKTRPQLVEPFLKAGLDVNIEYNHEALANDDDYGNLNGLCGSIILSAYINNQEHIDLIKPNIKIYLEYGANPNRSIAGRVSRWKEDNRGKNAVYFAVKYDESLLELLKGYGAKDEEIFIAAVRLNRVDLIEKYIDKIDINYTNDLGENALAFANTELAKRFIEKGVNVNISDERGDTFLIKHRKNIDMLKLLLSSGADIHSKDNNGDDVLLWAGHDVLPFKVISPTIIEFLLENGADINTKNNNHETMLHIAAREGHIEFVKFLLQKGINPNIQNTNGVTPLMLSAMTKKPSLVKLLIKAGADIEPKDNNAKNIFDYIDEYFGQEAQALKEAVQKDYEKAKQNKAKGIDITKPKAAKKIKYKYSPKTKKELIQLVKDTKVKLGTIDTSAITDMSEVFYKSTRKKFDGLELWNVSNVKNMKRMFKETKYFNHNINDWDTSNVEDMSGMFAEATAFNQPLNQWNTSKVTDMGGMFYYAYRFNQNIESWDTSNVKYMTNMFLSACSFNQPLNQWNTSKVTNMSGMFYCADDFNQPLDKWDVSNVERTIEMFGGVDFKGTKFNQPLDKWNISKVKMMCRMFKENEAFNQNLESWGKKIQKDCNTDEMFQHCPLGKNPPSWYNAANED